jgi:hypothetical protein
MRINKQLRRLKLPRLPDVKKEFLQIGKTKNCGPGPRGLDIQTFEDLFY